MNSLVASVIVRNLEKWAPIVNQIMTVEEQNGQWRAAIHGLPFAMGIGSTRHEAIGHYLCNVLHASSGGT